MRCLITFVWLAFLGSEVVAQSVSGSSSKGTGQAVPTQPTGQPRQPSAQPRTPGRQPAPAPVRKTDPQKPVMKAEPKPPPAPEPARIHFGSSFGYLYGVGDVRSFHVEVAAGYLLPVAGNALDVNLTAGYYTSSEREPKTDPLIGDFETEWHLLAIPMALNIEYWYWHTSQLALFGGLGFEYTYAKFDFASRSALGPIDPVDVTTGGAIGTRLQTGVRLGVGPGDILGKLKYTTSNIRNEIQQHTGDLGGVALLIGYEIRF